MAVPDRIGRARNGPPDPAGRYIVYVYKRRLFVFFGPIDDGRQFTEAFSALTSILPKLREKAADFGDACVFPVVADRPGRVSEWLKKPETFIDRSLDWSYRFLYFTAQVEAMRASGVAEGRSDRLVIAEVLDKLAIHEQGGGDPELPPVGNRIVSKEDADKVRETLAVDLIRSVDRNFSTDRFLADSNPAKYRFVSVLAGHAFERERVATPLIELATRGLEALSRAKDVSPDASRSALIQIGQVWLLHRSMTMKRSPYAIAAGALTKAEVREIAEELRRKGDSRAANDLDKIQDRESTAGAVVPLSDPAKKATADLVRQMVRSLDPSEAAHPLRETTKDEVSRGIEAAWAFLESRPGISPIRLNRDDLKAMAEAGADARQWRQLGEMLKAAFVISEAGEIVERAGGASLRGPASRDVARSVLAQFGQVADQKSRIVGTLAKRGLMDTGIDVAALIKSGGNGYARVAVTGLHADATRRELARAAGIDPVTGEERGLNADQVAKIADRLIGLAGELTPTLAKAFERARGAGTNGPGAKSLFEESSQFIVEEAARKAAAVILARSAEVGSPSDPTEIADAGRRVYQAARENFGLEIPPDRAPPKNLSDLQQTAKELANQGADRLTKSNPALGITPEIAREWLDQVLPLLPPTDQAWMPPTKSDSWSHEKNGQAKKRSGRASMATKTDSLTGLDSSGTMGEAAPKTTTDPNSTDGENSKAVKPGNSAPATMTGDNLANKHLELSDGTGGTTTNPNPADKGEKTATNPAGGPAGAATDPNAANKAVKMASNPAGGPAGVATDPNAANRAEKTASNPAGGPAGVATDPNAANRAEKTASNPAGGPAGVATDPNAANRAEKTANNPAGGPAGAATDPSTENKAEKTAGNPAGGPAGVATDHNAANRAEKTANNPAGGPAGAATDPTRGEQS